jgi:FlaA1/EpsC-like NDP-sugar epimerase
MEIVAFLVKWKRIVFFIADAALIALSVWLAFMVRFEAAVPGQYIEIIARLVLTGWIFYLPALAANRLYSFSWSYVSASELIVLARAVGLAFLVQTAAFYLLRDLAFFSGFPRSTIFITAFFVFILCGGLRFGKRIYLYFFKQKAGENVSRVLIAGAGDAGEQLLRSILNSSSDRYLAVGFADNHESRRGSVIHGVKVLGRLEDIPGIAAKYQVDELIIALPPGSKTVRETMRLAQKAGLKKIKIVPPLAEIIDGKFSLASVRRVEVEDLLERDKVSLDMGRIEEFIAGKKILVTGAAGSIGSELCRQIAKFGPAEMALLDQDETGIFNIQNELKKHFGHLRLASFVADIQNARRTDEIFRRFGPQIVFHAAAYKHVPLMEENAAEAVRNNIFGTKNVADAAIACNAQNFIFIPPTKRSIRHR